MIVSIAWDPMFMVFAIALFMSIVSAAVIIVQGIIKAKRLRLPRCKDCCYCKPIPNNAGPYFHGLERHCAFHRGRDEPGAKTGQIISVVTLDDYCSDFALIGLNGGTNGTKYAE